MSPVFRSGVKARNFRVIVVNAKVIEQVGLSSDETQWCVWFAQDKPGRLKPSKIPCNAQHTKLSVSDPAGWLTFAEAKQAYESGKFDGLGVLMSSCKKMAGLDLDQCLDDDGNVVQEKKEIVEDFISLGGYIERSPSGNGLRQFLKGVALDEYKEKSGDLEIYDAYCTRYLTITGSTWPEGAKPGAIRRNQESLEAFITKWAERKPEAPPPEFDHEKFGGVCRSVEQVQKLLRTYNKRGRITRLLAGDLSDYDGGHSEADAALCKEAAYFCRDENVIDGVIRQSELMRPKWDEMRGATTYGTRTIRQALAWQSRNFDHDQASKDAEQQRAVADKSQLARKFENLEGGFEGLIDGNGRIKKNLWVFGQLLFRDKRLLGACCFDQFSGFVLFNRSLAEVLGDKSAPSQTGRITDDHVRAVSLWFGREWGLDLKMEIVGQAVITWGQHVKINPVTTQLETFSAQWGGESRLDNWLIDCCRAVTKTDDGRDITEYVQAVGARWVISAVARAYRPGTKSDCMLVIEGKQGIRKSSAVRVLAEAIGPEYFREGFSLGQGKDDLVALRGRLVIEWGELSGLTKHDRNELKVFLSQTTDSYRQSYGVFEKDWPRTAVFCGTTNEAAYLADPSGGRRFWPVTVGRIDLDRLKSEAPQLWGEAVSRYKAGEKWWFDDDDPRDSRLLATVEREQARRIGGTFFSEIAADIADKLVLGQLAYVTKAGDLAEALPWDHFGVQQMRAWLSEHSTCLGDDSAKGNTSVIVISDANWPRICDGLRLAGWESRKSDRMRWYLTPEKRDHLGMLHGRDVGPNISPLKRVQRNQTEKGQKGFGFGSEEAVNDPNISHCEISKNAREGSG